MNKNDVLARRQKLALEAKYSGAAAWQNSATVVPIASRFERNTTQMISSPEERLLAGVHRNDARTVLRLLNVKKGTSQSPDFNVLDPNGNTALIVSAWKGYGSLVELLLGDERVDPTLSNRFGFTALMHAAERGHASVVALLLAHERVNPNHLSHTGAPALIMAAHGGHDAVVKLILAHPSVVPSIADRSGESALIAAARGGHEAAASLLLDDERVNPNAKSHGGRLLLQKQKTTICKSYIKVVMGVCAGVLRYVLALASSFTAWKIITDSFSSFSFL